MTDRLTAYRKRLLSKHSTEFSIHHEVAAALEAPLLALRSHATHLHLVIDMLMVQGLKSHAAVSLLCQHGLMEDTATIARRLLEISVQAVYICADSSETERLRRAGRYAAFMWRQLPRRLKHRLPKHVRARWTSLGRGYGRLVPKKAKSWGPNFRDMFKAVGSEDLYIQDYSFLSAIAHGSPEAHVFQFSSQTVRVHRDDFVPVLLVYSSRYYMALAEQWKGLYGEPGDEEFQRLTDLVVSWKH